MRQTFDPIADWPGTLPAVADQPRLQALKQGACQEAAHELPGAAQLYRIQRWLEKSPAEALLRDLLACIVAADCWSARAVAPRCMNARSTWPAFLQGRLESVYRQLQSALARWAVLERIPVEWLPGPLVRLHVASTLKRAGLQGEVTALHLKAPFAGGHEWVRGQCPGSLQMLQVSARQQPVAAILYWHTRLAPAVVTVVGSELKAFGPSFSPEGVTILEADLIGADLVVPANPPTTWFARCLRTVKLDRWIWRWQRKRRLRRGENPLVPP